MIYKKAVIIAFYINSYITIQASKLKSLDQLSQRKSSCRQKGPM